MGKVKTGLLAITGAAVGVITLRKFRNRRSKETAEGGVTGQVEQAKEKLEETGEEIDEATEDVDKAKHEAITAAKHAAGAVKHAGLAAGKAVENRRQTADDVDAVPDTVDSK